MPGGTWAIVYADEALGRDGEWWPDWSIGDEAYRAATRWASRITLEITEVRVQRLQDVSEEDCTEEGCDVDLLARFLQPRESKIKARPLHWIHGDASGDVLCPVCARKRTKHLRATNPEADIFVDGGWSGEEDYQRFCESCDAILDHSYTNHGVEEELEYLEQDGITDGLSAWIAARTIGLGSNPLLTKSCGDWHYMPELRGRIARLCYRALWESAHGQGSWKLNRWVWAITFRRLEVPDA